MCIYIENAYRGIANINNYREYNVCYSLSTIPLSTKQDNVQHTRTVASFAVCTSLAAGNSCYLSLHCYTLSEQNILQGFFRKVDGFTWNFYSLDQA